MLSFDSLMDNSGGVVVQLALGRAADVFGYSLSLVLSGPAIDRIDESPIEELIVTNTIPLSGEAQQCKKIKVLSVAHLIGEAIRRTHEEESISSLFV